MDPHDPAACNPDNRPTVEVPRGLQHLGLHVGRHLHVQLSHAGPIPHPVGSKRCRTALGSAWPT